MGTSTEQRIKKAHSDGVGVGMVIAATIILPQSDVYAEEVLGAAGIHTIGDMRKIGCDDYDIDQLRPVIAEMQRRRRWRSRQAKRTPQPKDRTNDE